MIVPRLRGPDVPHGDAPKHVHYDQDHCYQNHLNFSKKICVIKQYVTYSLRSPLKFFWVGHFDHVVAKEAESEVEITSYYAGHAANTGHYEEEVFSNYLVGPF